MNVRFIQIGGTKLKLTLLNSRHRFDGIINILYRLVELFFKPPDRYVCHISNIIREVINSL